MGTKGRDPAQTNFQQSKEQEGAHLETLLRLSANYISSSLKNEAFVQKFHLTKSEKIRFSSVRRITLVRCGLLTQDIILKPCAQNRAWKVKLAIPIERRV